MHEFGPERGHFLFIFDRFFQDFGLLALAFLIGLIRGDVLSVLKENFVILIIVLLPPFLKLAEYLNTTIYVSAEKLVVKSGIFMKKNMEIPAASITTIDYTQSILQQLFGAYRVKIDNVGNMSVGNDDSVVEMVFSKAQADRIAEILGKKRAGEDGANLADCVDENTGRNRKLLIPAGKIFKLALLDSKLVLFAEGLGVFGVAVSMLEEEDFNRILGKYAAVEIDMNLFTVAVIVFIVLAITFVIGAVRTLIRYSMFTVTDSEENIIIEYGLLTKKKYTLVKSRISGFSYEQSLLMKAFHVGTVQVYAVGFGNDSQDQYEKSILHPLLDERMVRGFIGEFTDMFSMECERRNAAPKSLKYFFYRIGTVITLVLLIASIVCAKIFAIWEIILIGAVIFSLYVLARCMERRNTSCGGNEKELVMSIGGLKKITTFIRMDQVETITTEGSIWKRKKNIVDIKVDFLGDELISSETACNMDAAMADHLETLLIY